MEKDDGVAGFEEVFCRRCTSRSCAEIVYESDCLTFEGDGSSTGCYQDHTPACRYMKSNELAGE